MATAILFSVPLMYFLGGITLWISYRLDSSIFSFLQNDALRFSIHLNLSILLYIPPIFVFLAVHELLHAMFVPNFLKSNQVFWGFNGLFAFVFTTQPIKKSRFLLISVMPYFLLSGALPFVLHFFHLLNGYTVFLCLLNGMGSSVDFLNFLLVAFQVPKGQNIVNNGFETYYENKKYGE